MALLDRVGSCFRPFHLACFDIYDNRIPFTSTPELIIKLLVTEGAYVHIEKMKTRLSPDKFTLKIEVRLL